MMITPLSYAIVGHLIGDYLLQNDWMANNKKKKSWPCFVHCLLYTFAVYCCTLWPAWAMGVVFVTHYLIDRTNFINWWMDNKGQRGFREGLAPWSGIVVDNVFHIVTLFLIHLFLTV